jgi:uncharacterized protein with HEPN domain
MSDGVRKHLFDIRHACEQIIKYAGGMSYEQLVGSEPTMLIVERLLITIGEAVVRLRNTTTEPVPPLRADLRGIIAVRNRVVHNYDTTLFRSIDPAAVYTLVTRHVGDLLREVSALLDADGTETTE